MAGHDNHTPNYSDKDTDYFGSERLEMIRFIPAKASLVLDVGCGAGGFGSALKKSRSGITVWGIEPNPSANVTAAERLDRVICSSFHASMSELVGRKFDCVIFNDVLEHLVDPAQALLAAKEYLSVNGSIIASIPNILYFPTILKILVTQDWKYEMSGVLDDTHLRFFTKKSIVRLFEECGYEIDEIQGVNPYMGLRFYFANTLFFGQLREWQFLEFAVRARVR